MPGMGAARSAMRVQQACSYGLQTTMGSCLQLQRLLWRHICCSYPWGLAALRGLDVLAARLPGTVGPTLRLLRQGAPRWGCALLAVLLAGSRSIRAVTEVK